MNQHDREKKIAEAEELLADLRQETGFAKGLFFGEYLHDKLPGYPDAGADPSTRQMVDQVRRFCREHIDPVAIDRNAEIPREVIAGLGRLGVLGACLPVSCGGRGMSQIEYCRILEVLGGHCGSTALFVNAHHSIGPRALVLFGTREQQKKYLPRLASGDAISAFALTEPEAGSDAANVQTQAIPTDEGNGFRLNGQKRWITNGGIAQVLTVMARTPVPGSRDTKITAFVVTPDMQGFEVTEARMEKCGVRGTVTSKLAFRDMYVPRENVLGPLGHGLKVALTVLDFGRTTFGASCTGAAKFCLQHATRHASSRVQFGQTLGSFELVQEKLAQMAAGTFAMEAATYQTAALIDSGAGDYMLETAMLKVFSTEVLWRIINDTIQIYGGLAYFTDQPFERMMRDARINMIGEGANDVLRAFVALVGMRQVGLELQGLLGAFMTPLQNLGTLARFTGRRLESLFSSPDVKVASGELRSDAELLGALVGQFGSQVERLLRTHRESIVDRQHLAGRVADAATELYVSASVLRRLDRMLSDNHVDTADQRVQIAAGRYYLRTAARRIRRYLSDLWDNDDEAVAATAAQLLNSVKASP